MPNVAATLKEEIIRLARREFRSEVRGMKRASAHYRRDIAALKRKLTKLQQQLANCSEVVAEGETVSPHNGAATRVRFTAKGLRSERKRLGLSADDYAKLLGVSAQSIYNWETEVTRPRKSHVQTIAALRGIGKKEARARLEKLQTIQTN